MVTGIQFMVTEGGVRLDAAVLRSCPTSTRAMVGEAIADGKILVNGHTATKGLRLRGGEEIGVVALGESIDNLVAASGQCPDPVCADAALLAFDKPAGMPVQPLSRRESGTLMNAVAVRYPECRALGPELSAVGENPLMAGAVHRIDADTSGLVLVARTISAFISLRNQFAAQTVEKRYLALVEGEVNSGGTLENDLVHDPSAPFCRIIDARRSRLTRAQSARLRPLHAVTKFTPLHQISSESETQTLLGVTIFTGVTHQIRAQLAIAGMHIVNDRTYGAFAVEGQVGHCLHSLSATFAHPVSGATTTVSVRPPSWAGDATSW